MKNYLLALVIALVGIPGLAKAQNGNGHDLQNIPVTDVSGMFGNATISITDFKVENNVVMVSSVLSCNMGGANVQIPATVPITILSSTCDGLVMTLGNQDVLLNGQQFNIGFLQVHISKKSNSPQVTNTLCSINHLLNSNASPATLVAKLKQLVKALV